jgi:hypothetical protein
MYSASERCFCWAAAACHSLITSASGHQIDYCERSPHVETWGRGTLLVQWNRDTETRSVCCCWPGCEAASGVSTRECRFDTVDRLAGWRTRVRTLEGICSPMLSPAVVISKGYREYNGRSVKQVTSVQWRGFWCVELCLHSPYFLRTSCSESCCEHGDEAREWDSRCLAVACAAQLFRANCPYHSRSGRSVIISGCSHSWAWSLCGR